MAKLLEKDPVLLEFGQRVREARRALGWTQEDLGEKVDLHPTYIGGIERGERNLGLLNIYKLAVALGGHDAGSRRPTESGRKMLPIVRRLIAIRPEN